MYDKNTLLFKELDGTFKSLEVEKISITSIYSLYAYDRIRRYVESDTLLSPNNLKEKNACDHVSKYFVAQITFFIKRFRGLLVNLIPMISWYLNRHVRLI